MDDKEIRERIEAAEHRDRNLLNTLGLELTTQLENVVDDLLVCMRLISGRLGETPPDFRRFAPSADVAELALQEWRIDVGIAAALVGAAATALLGQIHRKRDRTAARAIAHWRC
jgi:hypothetical protein